MTVNDLLNFSLGIVIFAIVLSGYLFFKGMTEKRDNLSAGVNAITGIVGFVAYSTALVFLIIARCTV